MENPPNMFMVKLATDDDLIFQYSLETGEQLEKNLRNSNATLVKEDDEPIA